MATCSNTGCQLPFDVKSLEDLVLKISDHFKIRVVCSERQARTAVLLTSGMTLLGGFIGRKLYGGRVGTVVGGVVGGACGLGIAAVSMREIWEEIKGHLQGLISIVYEYLSKLGFEDYYAIALFLAEHLSAEEDLAKLIIKYLQETLGKHVVSTLLLQ